MAVIESIVGLIITGAWVLFMMAESKSSCSSSSSSDWSRTHREQDEIRENNINNDYNQQMHAMNQEYHTERMQIANVPGY